MTALAMWRQFQLKQYIHFVNRGNRDVRGTIKRKVPATRQFPVPDFECAVSDLFLFILTKSFPGGNFSFAGGQKSASCRVVVRIRSSGPISPGFFVLSLLTSKHFTVCIEQRRIASLIDKIVHRGS